MSRRSVRVLQQQQHHEDMEVDDEEEEDSEENGEDQDSDEDENDDSEDDDDDGENDSREQTPSNRDSGGYGSRKGPSTSQQTVTKKLGRGKDNDSFRAIPGIQLSMDEMVTSTVTYILVMQHKKLPIKRADIVKHALNGQIKCYTEVMQKVQEEYRQRFGVELVSCEEGKGKNSAFASVIVVSQYPMEYTDGNVLRSLEADTKRVFLYNILVMCFMNNRAVEEEEIWKFYECMFINTHLCKKKDDIPKFLKAEYVATLYLKLDEIKETEQIMRKYNWGIRAHKEFSKYQMLKHVCSRLTDKKMYDFAIQYNAICESEKELIEADQNRNMDTSMNEEDVNDTEEYSQVVYMSNGQPRVEFRGENRSPNGSHLASSVNGDSRNMHIDQDVENASDAESATSGGTSHEAQDRSGSGSITSASGVSGSDSE